MQVIRAGSASSAWIENGGQLFESMHDRLERYSKGEPPRETPSTARERLQHIRRAPGE